eukprot:gb/GEZN01012458.1/.p1 GENE.gb/GEZN01012458.1/~~gb/GEZN01012458.1/.p1  ORF type:complete len:154 (-),score=21.32 gb/GEZN01012458.1/:419-880(-)
MFSTIFTNCKIYKPYFSGYSPNAVNTALNTNHDNPPTMDVFLLSPSFPSCPLLKRHTCAPTSYRRAPSFPASPLLTLSSTPPCPASSSILSTTSPSPLTPLHYLLFLTFLLSLSTCYPTPSPPPRRLNFSSPSPPPSSSSLSASSVPKRPFSP